MLEQVRVEGKKRPEWYAHFTLNATNVVLEIARQSNCPSTDTWEFLSRRSWTTEQAMTTQVRSIQNAERIAKTAVEMLQAGSSRNTIAIALQVDASTVDAALRAWEAGNRCHLPPKDFDHRRQSSTCKSEAIGDYVVEQRDIEGLSFESIAKQLDTTPSLVSRAYKQAKQEQTLRDAKLGQSPDSGRRLRLYAEKHQQIERLLLEGQLSKRAIAREVGCTPWTVRNEWKRLQLRRDAA
jgi:transposase-like protein